MALCLDEVTEEAANTTFMGDTQVFLLYQTTVLCNKRCSLAYYTHHLNCLKDVYWVLNSVLAALLVDADVHACLSLHKVDFLHEYNMSIMDFRGNFLAELDVTVLIMHPLWDLHVLVHVVCDCGVIEMLSVL